jgi:hypothetical protein
MLDIDFSLVMARLQADGKLGRGLRTRTPQPVITPQKSRSAVGIMGA